MKIGIAQTEYANLLRRLILVTLKSVRVFLNSKGNEELRNVLRTQ